MDSDRILLRWRYGPMHIESEAATKKETRENCVSFGVSFSIVSFPPKVSIRNCKYHIFVLVSRFIHLILSVCLFGLYHSVLTPSHLLSSPSSSSFSSSSSSLASLWTTEVILFGCFSASRLQPARHTSFRARLSIGCASFGSSSVCLLFVRVIHFEMVCARSIVVG